MAEDYRQASLDIWERMAAGWEDDRRAVWDASRVVGAGALAMLIRALPEADQAEVRRRTEEKLRPVVRTPGYNVAGLCLNVPAE